MRAAAGYDLDARCFPADSPALRVEREDGA